MSSRPRFSGRASTADHQAAVARRLDLLRQELAATTLLRAVPDMPDDRVPDDRVPDGRVPDGRVPDGWVPDGWVPDGPGGWVPHERVPVSGVRDDSAAPEGPQHGEWWDSATRIRPAAVAAEVDHAVAALPAAAPAYQVAVPGRHASRRSRAPLGPLLPDTLHGRVALGSAQVAVVAVVVAVGLAVTTWLVVRASPDPVPQAAAQEAPSDPGALVTLDPPAGADTGASSVGAAEPVSQAAAAGVGEAAAGEAAGAVTTVTVDVAGKVRRPGIAVLEPGARVVDAIAAAGGARAGVDLSSLNLARLLVDGEQVGVGIEPVAGVAAAALVSTAPAAGAAAVAPTALVDLNAATEDQLDTLPEVGPVTAQAIISWRAEHGGFTAVDELLEVDGIGEATLARIAPHVTV